MALVDKDYFFDEMREKNYPYWIVKRSDGGIVTEYEGNADIEASINRLNRLLEAITRGVYTIRSRKAKGANNTGIDTTKYIEFEVECKGKPTAAITGAGQERDINVTMPAQTENKYLQALIDQNTKLMEELKQTKEDAKHKELMGVIGKLSAKIDDLEDDIYSEDDQQQETANTLHLAGAPGPLNMQDEFYKKGIEILDQVKDPIARRISNAILPGSGDAPAQRKAPAAQQLADKVEEVTEKTDADINVSAANVEAVTKQLNYAEDAIVRLLKVDGAAGEHLLLLADLAELSPDKYQFGIGYIKGEVDKLKSVTNE
jgi:hypothetical protein